MKRLLTGIFLLTTLLLVPVFAAGAAGWSNQVYYVDRVSLIEDRVIVEFQGGDSITHQGSDAAVWAYVATQAMANDLPVQPWLDDSGQITGVRTWKP